VSSSRSHTDTPTNCDCFALSRGAFGAHVLGCPNAPTSEEAWRESDLFLGFGLERSQEDDPADV